ncbi:CgeB family protein [Actinopolymorpha pittospori]|uniref:Spore protein YkvP/CgeB glycosyl transferase-like domain-containing protein n=1 Tax=Actinopolymorpha pittospori TaxID=648752 RepID=A0A927MMH6_9ACTN|nr:glycosyltransferase [Actinopolymorpha pittospori]MBE1603249.1 hypothetical protein [Actinopolymorpha pittospori]
MNKHARVLFVGDLWRGSNAKSLADGFAAAGADVVTVDTTGVASPALGSPEWVYRKVKGRRAPWLLNRVHARIHAAADAFRPQFLVCFKSIHLDQDLLLHLPGNPVTVHYSPDDVSNPANTTPAYLAAEAGWDLVVTTKRHNVGELRARGARAVAFVRSAYDPAWHHLSYRPSPRRWPIGFIGNYRPDRVEVFRRLGAAFPGRCVIHGPYWRRALPRGIPGVAVSAGRYAEDFSTTVAGIQANLVLLNSDNRDTHTCRSFEVPAAGGLFVGERTTEHQELLTDGRECLLFDGEDELLDILGSLAPAAATRVAAAGHHRVTTSGHTYADRARQIMGTLTGRTELEVPA